MKLQATTIQIQNNKLYFKLRPFNYIQEHGIHTKGSNLRLVLKSFEAGWADHSWPHLALTSVVWKMCKSSK